MMPPVRTVSSRPARSVRQRRPERSEGGGSGGKNKKACGDFPQAFLLFRKYKGLEEGGCYDEVTDPTPVEVWACRAQ